MAAGPLKVTITEVETGQSVTLTDVDPATRAVLGRRPLHHAGRLAVRRLLHLGVHRAPRTGSRHLAVRQAPAVAGRVPRTTATAGTRTLMISAGDTGFLHPTVPSQLTNSASATFTNSTGSDWWRSRASPTRSASPVVTLRPGPAAQPGHRVGRSRRHPVQRPQPVQHGRHLLHHPGGEHRRGRPVDREVPGPGLVDRPGDQPQTISGTVFADAEPRQRPGRPGRAGHRRGAGHAPGRGQHRGDREPDGHDFGRRVVQPSSCQPQQRHRVHDHRGHRPGICPRGAGRRQHRRDHDRPRDHHRRAPVRPTPPATISARSSSAPSPASSTSTRNDNGIRQAGEGSVGQAVPITLTGVDDLGNAVLAHGAADAATGAYSFPDLRPGTYAVSEDSQPAGYLDGLDSQGRECPAGQLCDRRHHGHRGRPRAVPRRK